MENSDNKIVEMVGEVSRRYEFDDGLVFIHRNPTTREIVNYKNNVTFRRQGKGIKTQAAQQQLALADDILVDVGGLFYPAPDLKARALNKDTKPADIAHIKVEGAAPRAWKELVPAIRKIQFIETLLSGAETLEKN